MYGVHSAYRDMTSPKVPNGIIRFNNGIFVRTTHKLILNDQVIQLLNFITIAIHLLGVLFLNQTSEIVKNNCATKCLTRV